jgi:predicted RNase H-like nuclease (RuvC/YqgF family)
MAVTIAILSSLCAALAAGCIFCESRNGKLQKIIEESEQQITTLKTELEEFREQKRVTEEAHQQKSEKKPSKKIDFTGVFMR